MTTVTRWWWIRHAPVNSGGRIYGNCDVPADCSDRAMFRRVAAWLPREAVWIASHLQRTHQTVAAIRAEPPHDEAGPGPSDANALLADPELAEQNLGDWQGLTYDELERQRGDALSPFWIAPADHAPPGGESFVQLMARVSEAVWRHQEANVGRDIVAVTHGGTIRAALGLALGLPPEGALAFSIDNCSLTRIDHIAAAGDGAGAWRVSHVNLSPRHHH
ncbi:MAG: histidine phosphatase family protein [Kiloniellales bacterium]|nr:histidine phosphatase family protein [Kiloniellales bacterium]